MAVSQTSQPLASSLGTLERKKKKEKPQMDMENIGFQLMLKQMMNQNPMNPQKPKDMSATFFQMSSSKNQTALLEKMDKVIERIDMMSGVQANSFRGQEIVAKGNQFSLKDSPRMSYEVPEGTKVAMVHVMNDQNEVVKTYIGETTPGKHTIDFDGTGNFGQKLPEGTYKYTLETQDKDGVGMTAKLGRMELRDRTQQLMYQLPENADKATLVISNAEGRIVGAMNLTDREQLARGEHTVPFNGLDSKGAPLPSGNYTFKVKAWDNSGQDITTETLVAGKVEWGEMKDKVPMLNLGNGTMVPLSDYRSTRGTPLANAF